METYGGFEVIGYNIDYYIDGKFVGSVRTDEPEREIFGYGGRTSSVLSENIVLKKKTYKAGTKVATELIPLCGKSQIQQIIIKNRKSK